MTRDAVRFQDKAYDMAVGGPDYATLLRIFEQTSEAVVITDHSNRISMVNAAFTRLTGYESCDVLGQNPKMLSVQEHVDGIGRGWLL